MTYLAVGVLVLIGGGLGAGARFVLAEYLRQVRPGGDATFATLLVNVTGSFLLGLITGLADFNTAAVTASTALAGVGFCGAFTTVDLFALELSELVTARAWARLVAYLTASLTLGLLAAWLGLTLAAAA